MNYEQEIAGATFYWHALYNTENSKKIMNHDITLAAHHQSQ